MKAQRTTLDLSYAGFVLAFTLLVTLSGTTIWSHLKTEEDFNWVVHTGDVLVAYA